MAGRPDNSARGTHAVSAALASGVTLCGQCTLPVQAGGDWGVPLACPWLPCSAPNLPLHRAGLDTAEPTRCYLWTSLMAGDSHRDLPILRARHTWIVRYQSSWRGISLYALGELLDISAARLVRDRVCALSSMVSLNATAVSMYW